MAHNFNGGITLGKLMEALGRCPQDKPVYFDVLDVHPTQPDSYRGYYECLALGFADDGSEPNVETVLSWLRAADGQTFTGWKGGEFLMSPGTEMYVANSGNTASTIIVGVEDAGWRVILKTARY